MTSDTPCGSSGDTDCDNPDSCNGSGSCEVNNELSSVVCLACYQLSAPTFGARPQVEVSTQFQTSKFEVKKGKLLCLPATKTILP